MQRFYTGVGSRETPQDILELMVRLGESFARKGLILRSGGAEGADTAFEQGCDRFSKSLKEIYLPWPGFNHREPAAGGMTVAFVSGVWNKAEGIASQIHPAWDKLTQGGKKLHTRNVFQVLGSDLETPSNFLVYWALVDKNGIPKGGTRTAVMLARDRGIPTFNLADPEVAKKLRT